jgi:hypothetical protein
MDVSNEPHSIAPRLLKGIVGRLPREAQPGPVMAVCNILNHVIRLACCVLVIMRATLVWPMSVDVQPTALGGRLP